LPLDTRLSKAALSRVIDRLRPSVVIGADGEATSQRGEPVDDGDALVVATSGTTGEAKGVVLTHDAVEASARATSARLGVDASRDRWLACLPLSHVGGLSVLTRAMLTGTPVEIQPRFDPAETQRAALERGATLVSLVPLALARLGPKGAKMFRTIVLGGQQPPASRPANTVATYGMTETGSGVVYDGLALEGVQVQVDSGQIQLRGPMLLRCYRDGTDPKTADGWLLTGDAGALDARGRLVVHGRLDDVIISGGENIWPAQVEALLRAHAGVSEVAVGSVPDPAFGSRVVAYVVPAPDDGSLGAQGLLRELREIVKEQLAPYAAPRELVLVADLPQSALGKLNRAALGALDGPRALAG
jgi:O-succinylbenzoic acid--CoA ligase